jgi:Integral membrane protein DUF92
MYEIIDTTMMASRPCIDDNPDTIMFKQHQHQSKMPYNRQPRRTRMMCWSITLLLLVNVIHHNSCCDAFVVPAPANVADIIRASQSPTRIVQRQQQTSLLRVDYKSLPNDNARNHHHHHRHHQNRNMALQEPAMMIQSLVSSLLASPMGPVPLAQACTINAVGFAILLKPLSKMLTPSGLLNAFFLGSALWATLGWKGWSVCVTYLLLGVLVTKIRFSEKEKMGIAEKRGGQRGPENLWYVCRQKVPDNEFPCCLSDSQESSLTSCFTGVHHCSFVR